MYNYMTKQKNTMKIETSNRAHFAFILIFSANIPLNLQHCILKTCPVPINQKRMFLMQVTVDHAYTHVGRMSITFWQDHFRRQ